MGDVASDHHEGWSLGLAICRRLIDALGGQVTGESELNRGSIFTISLPPSCIVRDLDRAREPCACGPETARLSGGPGISR